MAAHAMVPIELFEAVIDQASDHPASLRGLSLTCQAFLPRARHHLFGDIIIRSVERLDAFYIFIETCPWAPTLVRRITLAMALHYNSCTPTIRLLDVAPTALLSRFPNLRSWRMEVTENDCGPKGQPLLLSPNRSILSCYERYGGRIQDLELSNISFDNVADFQALVLAFTGICSLSCSHIRFRSTAEGVRANAPLTQSPRLKRLHVSTSDHLWVCMIQELRMCNHKVGAFVDICAVEYLLGSSLDVLEHLILTVSSRPRDRDIFGETSERSHTCQSSDDCTREASKIDGPTVATSVTDTRHSLRATPFGRPRRRDHDTPKHSLCHKHPPLRLARPSAGRADRVRPPSHRQPWPLPLLGWHSTGRVQSVGRHTPYLSSLPDPPSSTRRRSRKKGQVLVSIHQTCFPKTGRGGIAYLYTPYVLFARILLRWN